VAEAAVEPRMVRQRVVQPAAAVQSDAAVGSAGPRYRVDLVAAAEPQKAPPVAAAAAIGAAAVPGALVAAPVPAALAAGPVAAATAIGAAAPDVVVVAAVPAVSVAVEPDALVVAPVPAGSAAAAFSLYPFPDLLEALGRQARY